MIPPTWPTVVGRLAAWGAVSEWVRVILAGARQHVSWQPSLQNLLHHIPMHIGQPMVAALIVVRQRSLAVDGSAELAAPDDERVVEQAAHLQVLQERRRGLIGVA